MNHFLNNQNSNSFLSKRLIFDVEKGSEAPKPLSDQERVAKLTETAVSESRKKAKSVAIDIGKQEAMGDKKTEAPKPKLPEIPKALDGLKIDEKAARTSNGNVEQPFTFGDLKIKGKVTFPEKPEANAKTTYLFNYVDDPSKFNQAKFIEELKKHKQDLGNTVIVTLKTPQGETKVDGKKVDTIASLTANLERFQEDLSKNPKFKDVKLARPETILHMTTKENTTRVTEALEKYYQNVTNDPRAVNALNLLDGDPDKFSSSLDKFIQSQNASAVADPNAQPDVKPVQPGGKGAGGYGSGGYKGGGAGGSPGGGSLEGASAGPGAGSPVSPEAPSVPKESKEDSPEGVNKLLIIGDSLMTGVENKIRANKIERFAKVGKTLSTILAEIRNFDKSGLLENYRNESLLINGGTNDLGGNPTQESILDNYKEIWAIAKKYNIKVFNCTMAPFGQNTYSSLTEKFEEKNAKRIWVNQQIEKMAGQDGGPYKVIGLHKKVSEGGLADDNNPDVLALSYKAPDGIHLNPEGYTAMAKAIQGIMGEPADPNKKPEGGAVAGAKYETGGMRPAKYTPELGEFASKVNQEFISSGAAYGTKKTVEFQGKTYTAIFTEHNKQEATDKYGKFQATELWEANDEAEKKSLKQFEVSDTYEIMDLEGGKVKVALDYGKNFSINRPHELVIFATPNGATHLSEAKLLENQASVLRNSVGGAGRNIVIAYVSAEGGKWPNYLFSNPTNVARINQRILTRVYEGANHIAPKAISLDAHSGGGSYIFNFIDNSPEIPSSISSLNLYDCLYAYNGMDHAQKIKKWLDRNSAATLTTVTGTPQIIAKQNALISDLQSLGVNFSKSVDNPTYSILSAYDGRIKLTTFKEFDHNGTITRDGLLYAHTNGRAHLSPKEQ